ncbi:hypothetical protein [Bacillus sp. RAR_GA_16]|uniref:tubby C-terminal domain-like protein n=1 Tax=Bacillus sp. RAR_GA_16 TaxID=2876774 RepID=UPI001CCA8BFF|nr:hypothetical protein [Bacillus sp. RAR_GA_16]MCA0173054.1 hypothetical protein [Bacillus sp. RAR_GA_16]
MVEYRFFNTLSTNASEIYGEDGNVIGKIEKYYRNGWEMIADLLLNGRFSGNYKVVDRHHRERFNAKRSLKFFKRRQYFIEYETDKATQEFIHLVDEKSFDVGEVTSFIYSGETFTLKKPVMEKAKIHKNGSAIAEWNSSLKVPFKAYFKLLDEQYENDKLLFLGLFHTYLHAG